MKLLRSSLLAVAFLWPAAAAAEIRLLDSRQEEIGDVRHEASVLCIDGQKFIYILADGTGTGVALTQVYEERNGQIVPARCQMPREVGRVPPLPPR